MNQASDVHEKDLIQSAAVEKIRGLVKSMRSCFFGTLPGSGPLHLRPMGIQAVDEAANFWFLSGRSSIKNAHIARNPRVQLLFMDDGSSRYLNLQGMATVSDSRALREKYWSPLAKAWFPAGIDDPDLTVIKVQPAEGHYWDTQHGKAVALLKIAASALTGQPLHEGVEGTVRL